MHTSLLPLLCCPDCRGELRFALPAAEAEVAGGALHCNGCGRNYEVGGGIPVLAPRDDLDAYADRWPDGVAHDDLVRVIEDGPRRYGFGGPFASWVDAASRTRGVVLDIATGPGSSLLGALAPRLSADTHLIATDASLYLLPRLKAAWATQTLKPALDFIAMDGNRWPLRDAVLDGVTSRGGFGSVWDDRERKLPPRFGNAYREAARALKPSGRIFESCFLYAEGSQSAAALEAHGCIDASRPKLEAFWWSLGLGIERVEELHRGEGKQHEGDLFPLGEHDVWSEMLYVLRKVQ